MSLMNTQEYWLDNNFAAFYSEYNFIIFGIFVLLARTIDVSLGTIRIIFISRGKRFPGALCGFFESLIWLFAIGQIVQNITNYFFYLTFATGYGLGTYCGIWLEEKLAMGTMLVRVITRKDATELIGHLRTLGYGVTSLDASGMSGRVQVFYSIIKRNNIDKVIGIIKEYNPNAFYSIQDIRHASEYVNPLGESYIRNLYSRLMKVK